MTTTIDVRRSATAGRVALTGAAVVAAAVNYLVARGAIALGADESFRPLTPPVVIAFTVIGVAVGYLGWRAIVRRGWRPGVVVPLVLAASMLPDLLLMATGFIPDTTTTGVAGLMVMHLVVAAVALPVYRRIYPVRG
ncbi:DUF6069 family protein [Kribbella sp. NPDC051952]|uniref:DUF6069 family protein n=1 Tax=Kribbella sp. NPDC051952 TaxID=3154851 RepID=UPI00343AD5AA